MDWLGKLFGFRWLCYDDVDERTTVSGPNGTRFVSQAELDQAYASMRATMATETLEQKARFYTEVAALLGNQSAADQLAARENDKPSR